MTAATYSTDLLTLTESTTSTGFLEPTATTPENWTNLNAITSAENDFYIQNTTCTSATIKVGVGGLLYNNGAGFTIPTDGAVLTWAYFWGPALLSATASGGIRTMIGSGTAAFYWVTHGGSDTWTYGGWLCLAMADPSAITVNTVGTPTATRQYAGWGYNALSVPARGNPYGIDAIRYGRCTIQVISGGAIGGGSGAFGTFADIATFNDRNDTTANATHTLINSGYHRLGIFQYQDGTYKWQGRLLLGTAATAVDFRDSNRSIIIQDTKHVTANFNLIEVQNAASRVDFTGISIQKIGTVSKGRFLASANADINFDSCSFTDMDTFTFQSNSTVISSTFRRCGLVTTGGGSFTNCVFDKPSGTSGVAVTSLSNLVNCSFSSDGTGHAVDLGTVSTTQSQTWGCTDTGYAATNGSTGNETILVNVAAGQTLTINVNAGKSTPTYRNLGSGTVSVVSGQVTLKIDGVVIGSDIVINTSETNTPLVSVNQNSSSSYDYTYTYIPNTKVDIKVTKAGYEIWVVYDYLLGSSNGTLPVAQRIDRAYQS